MKTLTKSLILGGVLLLALTPLISVGLNAQTLYKNQLSDNIVELESLNPDKDNRPNKLILIYDSTSLTFEFTETGELALISTINTQNLSSSGRGNRAKTSSNALLSEKFIKSLMKNAVTEDVDAEEELELQEWMMQPKSWLTN